MPEAERSSKSESSSWFVSIGYQLHRHLERPVSPPPTPAAGGMAVGTRIDPVLQVAAALRRGARGMHNIDRLAIIPAAWGRRDETILFWRERGSKACCFQNERLYSPTPPPSRFPARVKTTPLPFMFQHFSLKNALRYLKRQIARLIYVGHSA